MSFIKKFIEQETITRRNFLLASSYGVGGVGGGNIQYTVPATGDYTITFNDSTDTYSIVEFVDEESYTITTPEIKNSINPSAFISVDGPDVTTI